MTDPTMSRESDGRPLSKPPVALLGAVFLLAFANRSLPVLRGGGLSGVISYDDGVYYAGAVGLVHGQLPYRDVLFLHPPGILVALAPVATVGRWLGEITGWETSRLVWMLFGSVTSVLVALILLPLGRVPAAVGGTLYAVFPGAVLVERTTYCEGLANLALAGALLLVIRENQLVRRDADRRRGSWTAPVLVGVLLGYATTVKIWGLVPLLVVCLCAVAAWGLRRGPVVAASGAVTITVVCLPFFLAAPSQMWRMVVLDQVGRDQETSYRTRASQIATMGQLDEGWVGVIVAAVAAIGFGLCSVIAWRVKTYRVVVPLLAATAALLMVSPIFFPHYLGNVAVPLALLIGVVTGVLIAGAARAGGPLTPDAPARRGVRRAVLITLGLAVLVDLLALSRLESGRALPAELGELIQPASGCLTSDDPNNLLALGVLGRDIERGCPLVVDLGGYSHDLSRGATVRRGRNEAWQRVVLDYLGSGELAFATRFGRGRGLTSATATEIESWPVVLEVYGFVLREPPR